MVLCIVLLHYVMLNPEQQQAIQKNDCSLLIVAGAGTGKTRVLVEKIVHLLNSGVADNQILALTFTNKASDEMRARVSAQFSLTHSLFIGTFHSLCVSLLREFYQDANISEHFVIFDRDACKRVIKRCMKQEGIQDITPHVVQNTISRVKTGLCSDIPNDRKNIVDRLLPIYRIAMKTESALDFDDLLVFARDLLKTNPSVRKQVQPRYAYILVDEFQDTDGIQNQLISLLKGSQTHIVAVGDTDQTIYSWRGASVHNMLSFTDQYDPSSVVFLTRNYRSSSTILDSANAVIAKNVFRQDKDLVAVRQGGEPIVFMNSPDSETEATHIARSIANLRKDGVACCDIAVLFRANFQSRALETQMLAHQIPYTVLGTRFFDRSEVKDLLAYLILVQNPKSQDALSRAAGIPRRGIGARTLERIFSGDEHLLSSSATSRVAKLRSDIKHISDVAGTHSAAETLREILRVLKYDAYLSSTHDNPEERMQEVNELVSFADRFSHLSGVDGIAQMLAEVALSSEQDSLRTGSADTVRLMTVHASKGLEFSCVFIAGMEEGLFPFSHDERGSSDTEEERRLCYVAMTRAKDRLYCSYAQRRNLFGSWRSMQPSSFLSDVPEHLVTLSKPSLQTFDDADDPIAF